jgi:hypothetical protein
VPNVTTVSVAFGILCEVFVTLTPEKALEAGAAHFKPVASALSATKPAILQEQSQRIVVDRGIIPMLKC